MKYAKIAWYVLRGLLYLGIVVGVLSVASTPFETVLLAGLVELYAAILYNASLLAVTADANNHAAFVRFRTLATALGVTEDESGTYVEQEKALGDQINGYNTRLIIGEIANALVSFYAIYKIVRAVFFS